MTQTLSGMSFVNTKIEMSTNGTIWTDISGFANQIKVDGGDRDTGEAYTFNGDKAIVTAGKRKPTNLKCLAIYTEGLSDPSEILRGCYEAASPIYLRWSPKGGNSGNFQFVSDPGIVTSEPYPDGEAKTADPIVIDFTIATPGITRNILA
ncbi:MAG: hypothetical protein P4L50_03260 [Anaerolineaceae bacterium]|nr:hypothetical protein [Anaerolineaceae bacterium]